MNFIKKNWTLIIAISGLLILICFALLLIPESQIPTVLQSSGLVAILSAFLGVILTVAVTAFLLDKQSQTSKELINEQSNKEAENDKAAKIYQRKLTIYSAFTSKIWKMINEADVSETKTNERKDELRLMCFDKLVFFLKEDETKKLKDIIEKIDFTLDELKIEPFCEITNLLQNSLGDKQEDGKHLKDLYDAFDKNDKKETPNYSKANEQNQHIQQDMYKTQFWYFIMLHDLQLEAFKKGNWVLNLIEYRKDNWRTNLLRQVLPNDVVFLFRRGGSGYIGAFKVIGQRILNSKEYENNKYSKEEISEFDIYDSLSGAAYGDGVKSSFSSNLIVEPIAYNFMGVGYETVPLKTIWRMNNLNRVAFLLNRFNGNDKGWDKNRSKGNGFIEENIPVKINKDFMDKLINREDISACLKVDLLQKELNKNIANNVGIAGIWDSRCIYHHYRLQDDNRIVGLDIWFTEQKQWEINIYVNNEMPDSIKELLPEFFKKYPEKEKTTRGQGLAIGRPILKTFDAGTELSTIAEYLKELRGAIEKELQTKGLKYT